MRFRHFLALLAVPALVLSACGDDDSSESSDAPDTTTESDSGADVTPTVDPGDLDSSEEAFDSVVPDECEFLFDLSVSLGLAVAGQADSSDFDANQAPDEVKDDVQVLADAFESFDPTNPASAQAFSSDEVDEASQNIQTFIESNCDAAAIGQP